MSENIYYLLTGILEQVVPLLSLFMDFACWEKDLISGKDKLYCQYVSLAKQSCTYGLHFGLNQSHSLNGSIFLEHGLRERLWKSIYPGLVNTIFFCNILSPRLLIKFAISIARNNTDTALAPFLFLFVVDVAGKP